MLGKANNKYIFKLFSSNKQTDKYQKYGLMSAMDGIFRSKAMRLAAPILSITGVLTISFPGRVDAVFNRQTNNYRACAGRLVNNDISPEAASQACAKALYPGRLSVCVTKIVKQTELEAKDALASCEQARRPRDLATCVVGISKNNKEAVDPEVFNFCGSSLLPVRFAQCVVGLQSEIDLASTEAMETCIDASDSIAGVLPSFRPANQENPEPTPSLETDPTTPNTPDNSSTPNNSSTPDNSSTPNDSSTPDNPPG